MKHSRKSSNKTDRRATRLMTLASVCALAVLTACAGVQPPADVSGLRRVVGTDLVGARGATSNDQRKIDLTVAGLCAGKVWRVAECDRHDLESR